VQDYKGRAALRCWSFCPFGSPVSSQAVIYGHRRVTVPKQLMKRYKMASTAAPLNAAIIPVVTV